MGGFCDKLGHTNVNTRFKPMFLMRKATATALMLGSSVFATSLPVSAATVTTSIQNATLPTITGTPGSTSTTALQFKAFNAANFPALFTGLGPNQSFQLNNVFLNTKGKAGGSFIAGNYSTGIRGIVTSPAISYTLAANNLPSAANSTTNQTTGSSNSSKVGFATNQTLTTLNGGANPQDNSIYQICQFDGDNGDGTDSWLCTTPGTKSFAVNPSAASSSVNWTVSPGSNQTYPLNSSFWRTGTNIDLPSMIAFNALPGVFSGNLSLVNYSAQYMIDANRNDTFLTYDYELVTSAGVPAPLPLFGASLAFGFSRRLRRRINSASTLAS